MYILFEIWSGIQRNGTDLSSFSNMSDESDKTKLHCIVKAMELCYAETEEAEQQSKKLQSDGSTVWQQYNQ